VKRLFILLAGACGVVSGTTGNCSILTVGQTLRGRASPGRIPCFVVVVEAGEATQLTAEQPIDLMLRVVDGSDRTVTDGFEFGKETLTILAPGHYLVEVQAVGSGSAADWTFSMSRRAIPLQGAPGWRRAEASATVSKRTGKQEDLRESLLLWNELGENSAIARSYLKQGDAYLASNDPGAARAAYEQAIPICGSSADRRCLAEAANNSGYSSFLLGDLEESTRRLGEAVEDWRGISLPLFEGRTLSNLGLLFWQSGDFERTIRVLDDARRILRGRDAVAYARVLNNLGLYYQSLSENERAVAYFQSALEIFVAHHTHTVRVRMNLGRSNMLLGRLGIAKLLLESALTEAAQISDRSARADVLNNLGQLDLKRHRPDEARSYLAEALSLQRLVHSKWGEAVSLHYLGIEATQRGDLESGRRSLGEAAHLRRATGLRDDASESVFALAELEYKAVNFDDARELAGQATELIESIRSRVPSVALRATYYARKRRLFDLLTDIAMLPGASGDGIAGFEVSEQARGRSYLDMLAAGGIGGEIPKELFDRRTNLRRQIAVYSLRLTAADPPRLSEAARRDLEGVREDLKKRIELLLSEDDQVEARIHEAAHASTLGRPLTSVAEIQAVLPGGSALLEYYLGERQSYLWVVQTDRVQSFRLPPRASIEALAMRTVNSFGAILDRRRSREAEMAFQADLTRLSSILLGPLQALRLPRHLILVLDGALNRVPMAALRPTWAREAIGLSFDIVQAPSAAYLLAATPPRPVSMFPMSVLALVDPVFSADDPRLPLVPKQSGRAPLMPRLPFTGEVAVLKSLLPPARVRVLQNFDAASETLGRLNLADFALLHFSTHAFIDDRIPELSRVVLSLVNRAGRPVDGNIHPYQFAEFRLNRSIVVLSSCETALGKEVSGEGLVGFANGLFAAGASQLVLSLTKVDAESSSVFFSEVYRRFLASQPVGMEIALTQARRVLAHSARWSDPYYWAPFTVIGGLSGLSTAR